MEGHGRSRKVTEGHGLLPRRELHAQHDTRRVQEQEQEGRVRGSQRCSPEAAKEGIFW